MNDLAQPNWLANSIEAANSWYAAHQAYADAITANWIDHDKPDRALQAQQETSEDAD